jgi:aminoglycoside phosphotransferase (APT) family kinase protein
MSNTDKPPLTQAQSWTQANAGTAPVSDPQWGGEGLLVRWMEAHVQDFQGPVSVEQFKGGQSNPTYKLVTPTRVYVLRRKPAGPLLKSAHAVDREYRVICALHRQGFPVPRARALCTDDAVIGSWFFVMDFVDGKIFWDTSFPEVPRAERRAYFAAMNEVLGRLHGLNPVAVGLGDYGPAGSYLPRQIARWTKQYLSDEIAGRLPAIDHLVEWLPANIPHGEELAIVHGDFRSDNLIFDANEARVLAVLDWELSTLGHPLVDFCFHAMMYRVPANLIGGLRGVDLAASNIPTEKEYVDLYCHNTHREGIPHYEFYLAFNMFRLAAILHGIKARALRGTASSPHALEASRRLEELATLAWDQARRAARG